MSRSHLIRCLLFSFAFHGLLLSLPATQGSFLVSTGDLVKPLHPGAALTVRLQLAPSSSKELNSPLESQFSRTGAKQSNTSFPVTTPEPDSGPVASVGIGLSPVYFPWKMLSRMPEALSEFVPLATVTTEGHIVGQVQFRLWIDRNGIVDRVQVLEGSVPADLLRSVQGGFQRMHFRPGEIDGQPVPSWSDVVVDLDSYLESVDSAAGIH